MANYQNEINDLDRQLTEYLPTILQKQYEIAAIDLSKYSPEYQEQERQKLYDKAKPEIDTILGRFEKSIEEIRNRMASNSFADHTMLKDKQSFAQAHGLTLLEAERYISDYVRTADLSEVTDERSPYHKLYMAELARSGRQEADVYNALFDKDKKAKHESRELLNRISNKIREIKQAPLSSVPITGGDIIIAKLRKQQNGTN